MPGDTNFPTALDDQWPIGAEVPQDQPGVFHDEVHLSDRAAILALQTKVGIDSSADPDSLDYRMAAAESDIAGKADASHQHDAGDITSGTFANARVSEASVKQHEAALAIDYGQLTGTPPSFLVSDVYTVADEAAQLALVAQEGDIAIRSDENKTYAHNGGSSGTMADWSLLLTPTDAVLSVAGKTGAVTLVKGDVGLGNVDNTSDADKPVSTATQTALDAKQDETPSTTALAALSWVANALAIGTGADAVGLASFAANTLPGRSSSGNLVAKTCSDDAFAFLAAADNAAMRTALGAATDSAVVHLAGSETVSGAKTFSAAMQINNTLTVTSWARVVQGDGVSSAFIGATKAIRIQHSATESLIEGVDSTLFGSYQPIGIRGSEIQLYGPTQVNGALVTTDNINCQSNVIYVGKSGAGYGGNVRFTDDGGTLRWLAGILGSTGARDFHLYDIATGASRMTVTATGGGVTIPTGDGALPAVANQVAFGGGGTSPNAATICWGDNTGWLMRLGTSVAGSFAPRFTFRDTGNLGIGVPPLDATLALSGRAANWGESTPGLAHGDLHLMPHTSADHYGCAITFGASDVGTYWAQAGIYTRTDGSYGTKMYFATTDNYGVGSKAGAMIDHVGRFGVGTVAPEYKVHAAGIVCADMGFLVSDVYALAAVTSASETRAVVATNGEVQTLSANQGFTLTMSGPSGRSGSVWLYLYNSDASAISITKGSGVYPSDPSTFSLAGFTTGVYEIRWDGTRAFYRVFATEPGDARPT